MKNEKGKKQGLKASPAFLISLAVSALLGLIGGSAFHWAASRSWSIFTAAFLWTLIASAGTTIGRFSIERLRRGAWRKGLWLAMVQSFPLTTIFLLVAAPFARGSVFQPSVIPVLYACTLAIALLVGLFGILTSPFTR